MCCALDDGFPVLMHCKILLLLSTAKGSSNHIKHSAVVQGWAKQRIRHKKRAIKNVKGVLKVQEFPVL